MQARLASLLKQSVLGLATAACLTRGVYASPPSAPAQPSTPSTLPIPSASPQAPVPSALPTPRTWGSSLARAYVVRLTPGQDLKNELLEFARRHQLRAATVVSCVGSLQHASLRFADMPAPTPLEGKFEITSLVGTLGPDGAHLHLGMADATGHAWGGHVTPGCTIYTTAEVVILECEQLDFRRLDDPQTHSKELHVEARSSVPPRTP